jgi:hypothetical protein
MVTGVGRSGGFKPLSTGADSRWAAIKAPLGIDAAAEQTGDAPLLQNCRPAPKSGLPPALASPIFGRIADAVSSTVDPSEEDMIAAFELCDIASSYLEYQVSSHQLLLLHGSAYQFAGYEQATLQSVHAMFPLAHVTHSDLET